MYRTPLILFEEPKRDAKTVPGVIERHAFTETRVTAYRLKIAA